MIAPARDAGASQAGRGCARLLLALCLAVAAVPLRSAELTLLHAEPAVVHEMAPGRPDAAAGSRQVQLTAGGKVHVLQLRPNEELATLGRRLAGRAQAYEGKVDGIAGSWAALTRIGNRWSGIWYDGGEYFGVDSARALAKISARATDLPADKPVVYSLRDLVWEELPVEGDTIAIPRQNGAQLAGQLNGISWQPGDAAPRRLEIAVVADAALAALDGAETETNLLSQLNIVDGLFASQVGVRIAADSVTIFTRYEDEPFTRTGDAEELLAEIAAWRADAPEQRAAGLTHVFTGRNLQGRTVGMAYIDSLCNKRYSASLSQATYAPASAALIAAHEIAHVFGSPHDGDAAQACAATPTDFLMSPRINGSQLFSACSIAQMSPQVQAASCLAAVQVGSEPGPEGLPVSDDGGGGGALPDWIFVALALLLALRLRAAQIRANHLEQSRSGFSAAQIRANHSAR